MGSTAFLADPVPSPGEYMGGPAGAGVGLQADRDSLKCFVESLVKQQEVCDLCRR